MDAFVPINRVHLQISSGTQMDDGQVVLYVAPSVGSCASVENT